MAEDTRRLEEQIRNLIHQVDELKRQFDTEKRAEKRTFKITKTNHWLYQTGHAIDACSWFGVGPA
jgi:hypothetical protein